MELDYIVNAQDSEGNTAMHMAGPLSAYPLPKPALLHVRYCGAGGLRACSAQSGTGIA